MKKFISIIVSSVLLIFSFNHCKQKFLNIDPPLVMSEISNLVLSPQPGSYIGGQDVSITTSTPDVKIWYTTDGVEPTCGTGTQYTAPIIVDASQTIKVIACKDNYQSKTVSGTYDIVGTVARPSFSPSGGNYATSKSVTMTTTTGGAQIRYTLDGSEPTHEYGTLYSGAVTVDNTVKIKAIAYLSSSNYSGISSATYSIDGTTGNPIVKLSGGYYSTSQSLTFDFQTPGSTIWYTTDGSDPRVSGTKTQYTGAAIPITLTVTIKAVALFNAIYSSVVTTEYIFRPEKPVYSKPAGIYYSALSVSISTPTPDTFIYYTTNGDNPIVPGICGDPGAGSTTRYSTNIDIITDTTVKAVACKTGWPLSPISSVFYDISDICPVPSISPAAGTYANSQSITITPGTDGAITYYTTNGDNPIVPGTCGNPGSGSTTKYTGAFILSEAHGNQVVKARSCLPGLDNSSIVSKTYVVLIPGIWDSHNWDYAKWQ